MTRLTLFISVLFYSLPMLGQVPSSCTPTPAFAALYEKDAKDMALGYLYSIHSPDTALIEIPTIYSDSVMTGLAAIFNTGAAIEADSIFNNYCVHALPYGFTRKSIGVWVDTSYSWTGYWASLNSATGNVPLDNFMNLHGFTIKSFHSDSWGNQAVITTTHILNWKTFADSLELFPGVYSTSLEYDVVGSGNRISYERSSDQTYTFVAGWGDCPAGCTSSKTWIYKVDTSCNVTLVSAIRNGDDENWWYMPNCAFVKVPQVNKDMHARPYPNPVNDILHISTQGESSYTLTDIYGKAVQAGTGTDDIIVNVGNLPRGLYMLRIGDEKGEQHFEKVIKN